MKFFRDGKGRIFHYLVHGHHVGLVDPAGKPMHTPVPLARGEVPLEVARELAKMWQ